MKSFIKVIVLPSLFLVGLSTQGFAQGRRTSTTNTTTTRTTTPVKTTTTTIKTSTPVKTTPTVATKRVPSSKVTYKTAKKKVVAVRTVSNRKVINHNGQKYYYANNKYYTQSRGRYIPIAPKVGFRINTLPSNSVRINFNNRSYFNVSGIFYFQSGNQYEVVEPEVGTIVSELPNDYEKVVIDGLTYYEYANVLYEKVQVNGTRAYEVVGLIDIQ